MKRVLLLLPNTGNPNDDFLAAAKKLGVEIVAAAVMLSVLEGMRLIGEPSVPRINP